VIWITGCPRSGTAYSATYLKQLGYKIGHESKKEHGIVDWHLNWFLGNRLPSDVTILHQVRYPVDVINSMGALNGRSKKELKILYDTEGPQYWWLFHNQWIEEHLKPVYRFRIEDWDEVLPDILSYLPEIELNQKPNPSKTLNTYKTRADKLKAYHRLRWPHLLPEVQQMAERYGYGENW
jgi:hypothetical protein